MTMASNNENTMKYLYHKIFNSKQINENGKYQNISQYLLTFLGSLGLL